MNLHDTLRKAAGLLVELPPEEITETTPETESHAAPQPGVHAPMPTKPGSAPSETDKLWADLEKAAQPLRGGNVTAGAPTKTVGQIVREGDGPNLDQIQVAPNTLPAGANVGGTVDFAAIYQAAKLPSAPYTAEQILEMLASLPAELPLDTRRIMVKAAMNSMGKAIGATAETIVADASRKLAALAAYTDNLTKLSTEYAATSERKIAGLQAEIETTRAAMTAAQQRQTQETERCQAEARRLDEVLEFFSLDVPPSRHAPAEPAKPNP